MGFPVTLPVVFASTDADFAAFGRGVLVCSFVTGSDGCTARAVRGGGVSRLRTVSAFGFDFASSTVVIGGVGAGSAVRMASETGAAADVLTVKGEHPLMAPWLHHPPRAKVRRSTVFGPRCTQPLQKSDQTQRVEGRVGFDPYPPGTVRGDLGDPPG
ncbi:MAG: hypothetical protein HC834_10955, partial [Rhodospirillales bacterium]|nr:hypothetical protein [Rhodospirillales bacterium]